MSWHYLQEQEAAFWEENSLDGAPSALLRLLPPHAGHCLIGSGMESCRGSLSGMMSPPLTDGLGAEPSMSSVGGSHAPTSAPQGKAQGSTDRPADSGWRWPGSFAKFDPVSRLWRTRQFSLLGGLTEYLETWPRWGSMRNGECLALDPLDFPTPENESGSLPTPSGVNAGKNHTMGRVDEWGGSSNPLRGTVIGSLCSPEFEELVMGWPVTWTAPTPLETARFQQWLRMHGAFFQHHRSR